MHRLTFHLSLLTEMKFRYAIFRALFIILIDFVRLMSSTCGLSVCGLHRSGNMEYCLIIVIGVSS